MAITSRKTYSIFLSYRRSDSSGHAGWLFERLAKRFGSLSVFMDRESVALGSDWLDSIQNALRTCRVMMVVIGRSWTASFQAAGTSTTDFVRFEVARALTIPDVRIIPILVDDAQMPTADALPADISAIARLQAMHLRNATFGFDCDGLIREIERTLSLGDEPVSRPKRGRGHRDVSNVVVADIRDLAESGWTTPELIDHLLLLEDGMVDGLTPEYVGTGPQWAPILDAHPDTWRVLLSPERSVIANWHFVALDAEDFAIARTGRLLEGDITPERVRHIDVPGFYNIYFVAAFVVPKFRQLHTIQLFRTSILDHFIYLAKQKVFIDTVCANAYTKTGEAFCISFGLQPGNPHQRRGRIYERTLFPVPDSLGYPHTKELNRLYQRALQKRGTQKT